MQERIAELLKQPYARVLIPEDEGGYSAFVLEFPGCISSGDTADEAMENLTEAMTMWLEAVIEEGQNVPTPAEATEYSGRLNLRMPETIHRDAAVRAQIDGVSLNHWIVSAISRALGAEDSTGQIKSVAAFLYSLSVYQFAQGHPGEEWTQPWTTLPLIPKYEPPDFGDFLKAWDPFFGVKKPR